MSGRDFLLLFLVCLVFGLNFPVSKFVLTGADGLGGLPPFFFAGLRMALIAALLAPLLARRPPRMGLVAMYAALHGAVHFTLLYIGVQLTSASLAAVVFPVYVPVATVLSILFLNDRVGPVRGAGIAAALAGVAVLGFDAGSVELSLGVWAVAGAAVAAGAASVLNRRLGDALGPMQSQAWVGVLSCVPLLALSFVFESGQLTALAEGGLPLYAAIAYTLGPVSVFGHAALFFILSRNSPTIVSPLTLMATGWGVAFSVWLMGDPLTWRLLIGGGLTVVGVLTVLWREPGEKAKAVLSEESAR
ncbi:MAG: DMT family transporter [Caulobacterales bacterium]|nr:DMT family transporter [Caulobacterales bacterium]